MIHYFQHFHKSTESTLGGGVNPVVCFKMLILATVPVHETINIFIVHFWVGEGYLKRVLSVRL